MSDQSLPVTDALSATGIVTEFSTLTATINIMCLVVDNEGCLRFGGTIEGSTWNFEADNGCPIDADSGFELSAKDLLALEQVHLSWQSFGDALTHDPSPTVRIDFSDVQGSHLGHITFYPDELIAGNAGSGVGRFYAVGDC